MQSNPRFLPAVEVRRMIRAGEVSSEELVETFVEAVEDHGGTVNAVVFLDAEGARKQAQEADRAAARGEWWGPLHGLPFTVKDSLETAGMRTTSGSATLADHVPGHDAPTVARLREAGAILLGKTNLPTWALGAETRNEVFGTTRNPWNPDLTPGGSSGGSAAAVASGFSCFDLGSDIGGSLRVPAAFCGVSAHKPSYGLVPQRGHIAGPSGHLADADMNVIGPVCRAVEDLEPLLDVLAGPLPEAARAWKLELPPPRYRWIEDYRIGLWTTNGDHTPEDASLNLLHDAALLLSGAGARLSEDLPRLAPLPYQELFLELLESASTPALPPELAEITSVSHHRWLALNEIRERVCDAWADYFREHDALLCPVVPIQPFPADEERPMAARRFTVQGRKLSLLDCLGWAGLASLARLPATVVPVGLDRQGLPVAIQVIGPFLEDRTSLFVARRLSELVGPLPVPPPAVTQDRDGLEEARRG